MSNKSIDRDRIRGAVNRDDSAASALIRPHSAETSPKNAPSSENTEESISIHPDVAARKGYRERTESYAETHKLKGVYFPNELLAETERLAKSAGLSDSRYIQDAVTHYNYLMRTGQCPE